MQLRVLSYNIHKGFSPLNQKLVLDQIKSSIRAMEADLVCLQEVLGEHQGHAERHEAWPKQSQFEYLADQVWSHYSYGQNAVYSEGHHGNAILSKHPITFTENEDVSPHRYEKRGLLHAQIPLPGLEFPLHVFSVHLALFERHRDQQLMRLAARIEEKIPSNAPWIIAGDFNDWRQSANLVLMEQLGAKEAFWSMAGKHAKTFPGKWPLLALDRIYYKNMECIRAEVCQGELWNQLSDHLPLLAEFKLT